MSGIARRRAYFEKQLIGSIFRRREFRGWSDDETSVLTGLAIYGICCKGGRAAAQRYAGQIQEEAELLEAINKSTPGLFREAEVGSADRQILLTPVAGRHR